MTSALPPLDLHAHIHVGISSEDVRRLGAVVFAATRSLAEAQQASGRHDDLVVWGVGSHPGLARSHTTFDPAMFSNLIARTAFVGELGLDASAKIALERQGTTLAAALDVLAETPRITSLHSYRATNEVLDALTQRPVSGVVLHWWLGSAAATQRALDLGCYFSVNAAMFRRPSVLRQIPLSRILTETDHPYGDVSGPQPQRPGNVIPVEHAVARLHGLTPDEVRRHMWANLNALVREAQCRHLLSRRISSFLIVASM